MTRRRRKKNNKASFNFNKRRLVYIAGVLCFLLLIWAGITTMQKSKTFLIRQSDIKTNVPLSQAVIDHVLARSIFSVDLAYVGDSVMKGHPEYKTIRVKKNFPRELLIEVDKRGSFAQIKNKNYYPVDKDAIILADGSFQALGNLIPIEYDDTYRGLAKGQRIEDKRLSLAFELIELMAREDIFRRFIVSLVNVVNSQSSYFLVQSNEPGQDAAGDLKVIKILVGETGYSGKIKIFKSLIDGELRDKISLVKYIDLRHKKVYVGFRR